MFFPQCQLDLILFLAQMMPSARFLIKSRFHGRFRQFLPNIVLKTGPCAKIPRTMREKYPPPASIFPAYIDLGGAFTVGCSAPGWPS